MRVKNLGKKICIFTIILALIVTLLYMIIVNIKVRNKNIEEVNTSEKIEKLNVVLADDLYYNNYWPKNIIKDVVCDNVPVPKGFEYSKGDKDSGIIVKKDNKDEYLMWIPYDENVEVSNEDKYYTKCEYKEMDIDTLESIKSYGGFYINVTDESQFNKLEIINDEQYEKITEKAKKINEDTENISSHLVYKEEIAQIQAYGNKIGKNLNGIVSSTIDSYIQVSSETVTLKLTEDMTVTIPDGFEVFTYRDEDKDINKGTIPINNSGNLNRIIKIKDIDNPNLVYVWVPVDVEISELKQKISNFYSEIKLDNETGIYMYNWEAEDPVDSNEYKELVKSIEKYKGFYIAEAELGYTQDKVITNRARGMKKYEKGGLGVTSGEYYRGNDKECNTQDKMKEIANIYKDQKNSVKSHLTYGFEWDAVMYWFVKEGNISAEQLGLDSSKIIGAKYKNNLNKEIKDKDVIGIKGIYGLAGNLIDVTQEVKKYDQTSQADRVELSEQYIIGRGGSYNDSGNSQTGGTPIGSRMTLTKEQINSQYVGFRNCLYIVDSEEKDNQKEIPEKKDEDSNMEYNFENTLAGTAQGTISIKNLEKDGICKLYWGSDSDVLQNYLEFVEINIQGGSGKVDIEKSVLIPSGATKIYGYIDNKVMFTYSIPENKKFNTNNTAIGNYQYSFGALSDVHYNGGGEEGNQRFAKILQWYTSQNVSSVMVSGDISAGDANVDSGNKELSNVKAAINCVKNNLGSNIKFYSSKGNHDGRINNYNWNKDLFQIPDNQISKSGECYVVESQNKKDLNIMVHVKSSSVNTKYSKEVISDDAIQELEELLKTHYNNYEKIYVFEHIFISNTSGEVYNTANQPIATSWTMNSKQEQRLKNILKTYKDKVVMFSGHSHWRYDQQKFNADLNIYDGGGEYAPMVHLSSLLSPRVLLTNNVNGEKGTDYGSSEAMIVEVYDNAIVLKALNVIPYVNGTLTSPAYESYASHIIYF